jgi:hypothetical protein
MAQSKTSHANSHIDAFLKHDTLLPVLPQPEFIPIFARASRLGGTQKIDKLEPQNPSIPSKLPDLPSMLPNSAKVDDDTDLYKQHMAIVDGWGKCSVFFRLLNFIIVNCAETFAPSSPSSIGTPSLGSGTSDIDELFLMSPPGKQPAFVQELMASKIGLLFHQFRLSYRPI